MEESDMKYCVKCTCLPVSTNVAFIEIVLWVWIKYQTSVCIRTSQYGQKIDQKQLTSDTSIVKLGPDLISFFSLFICGIGSQKVILKFGRSKFDCLRKVLCTFNYFSLCVNLEPLLVLIPIAYTLSLSLSLSVYILG